MKVLILFCALVTLGCARFVPKKPGDFVGSRTQCYKELKTPANFQKEIDSFKYSDHPAVHKYVYCSAIKLQLFDPKTGFIVDNLIAQFGHERSLFNQCVDKKKSAESVEEWAYRNSNCLIGKGLLQAVKKNYGHSAPGGGLRSRPRG